MVLMIYERSKELPPRADREVLCRKQKASSAYEATLLPVKCGQLVGRFDLHQGLIMCFAGGEVVGFLPVSAFIQLHPDLHVQPPPFFLHLPAGSPPEIAFPLFNAFGCGACFGAHGGLAREGACHLPECNPLCNEVASCATFSSAIHCCASHYKDWQNTTARTILAATTELPGLPKYARTNDTGSNNRACFQGPPPPPHKHRNFTQLSTPRPRRRG